MSPFVVVHMLSVLLVFTPVSYCIQLSLPYYYTLFLNSNTYPTESDTYS